MPFCQSPAKIVLGDPTNEVFVLIFVTKSKRFAAFPTRQRCRCGLTLLGIRRKRAFVSPQMNTDPDSIGTDGSEQIETGKMFRYRVSRGVSVLRVACGDHAHG